jgi:gamma-glutamylaminecyclotransferase
MMQRVLLFVYGTLMRGEGAHGLLGPTARFVAEARTEPQFTLVDMGEYPALVEGGTTAVRGELYEIDAALLAALDRYEDVPEMYERRPVAAGGQHAIAYVLRQHLAEGVGVIASGDWRAHNA